MPKSKRTSTSAGSLLELAKSESPRQPGRCPPMELFATNYPKRFAELVQVVEKYLAGELTNFQSDTHISRWIIDNCPEANVKSESTMRKWVRSRGKK